MFIPELSYPRLVSIITFCCVRIRRASFLAINRRGCNVNSPGPRTSIGRVDHADLMYISSTLNHFCSSVMVNPKKNICGWEFLRITQASTSYIRLPKG